jgi:Spx/MgsR family transcriptional regulator
MEMYGIKNCDTVKKAKDFLEENEVAYDFVDYKKEPPTEKLLQNWIDKIGIALVLNKQGTTYRKLSDEQNKAMDNVN